MFPKLSLSTVVKEHLDSLKSYSTISDVTKSENGKHTIWCFLAFIGLPIALTYTLYEPYGKITNELISLILNANSIFVALLLNLIVLLYSMKEKLINSESATKKELRKQLIQYTFANVSFQILLSLMIIVLALLHGRLIDGFLVTVFDTLIIFLMIQVVMGIILILNRLSKLFSIN